MNKATIIRDKLSGQTFAVLVPKNGNKITAIGSLGQGQLWAQWAMSSPSSEGVLNNLDVSLVVEKDVELTEQFVASLENTFALADLNELKYIMSEKVLLVIEKVKSLAGEEPANYEYMNEDNEEEEIDRWPLVDAAIATIDVAYKQIALDYKAKAFNLDSKRSSMLLQVKGVRAMWDPNMPGGGGWRCPDDTPYGGQFTNRLGRGCTFGAIRRIGRSLMTASLKDMAKDFGDDNIAFPTVYRAGQRLDQAGDRLKKATGEKYNRRAMRRADELKKTQARQMLKESRPTFRQRYESLGPEVSRKNRVLIAAAQTTRDIADDQATRGFVAESRRKNRRLGTPTRKSSVTQTGQVDGGSSISGAMSAESRAMLASKLRNTASDILEGRRFSRRQKSKDVPRTPNSPMLSEKEVERSNRIVRQQIQSIVDKLDDSKTGKKYLAEIVEKTVYAMRNWSGDKTEPLGFPDEPHGPGTEYTEADFDDADVQTVKNALLQLLENPNRPFADQRWGRFENLFKLWGTYHYPVGISMPLQNEKGEVISSYIPRLKKPSTAPDIYPELWTDGMSLNEHGFRSQEELIEVNNAYTTLGFLHSDATKDTIDELNETLGKWYGGDEDGVFGNMVRDAAENPDKYTKAAMNVVLKGIQGQHENDLRKFLHNRFYSSTLWNSPKKPERKEQDIVPTQSIVERFMSGATASRDKEQRKLERELRGKVPRSTTRLLERFALRQRRRAKEQSGELVGFEDYPEYETPKINKPEIAGGKRKVSEFTSYPLPPNSTRERARERWTTDLSKGGRPKVDAIIREMEPHLVTGQFNEDTFKGIADLDKFFTSELNHAAIARLRESALSDFDLKHQERLREIYNDWLKSFNDPNEAPQAGSPSNMGLTEQSSVSWVVPGEPGFMSENLDDVWQYALSRDPADSNYQPLTMDAVGDRTVLRATEKSGKPIVYVEDTEAQVAHLMTTDGRHLLSMVTTREGGGTPSRVRFIAGSAATEQIVREQMRPTVRERISRLTGRDRRRTAAVSKPAEIAKTRQRLNVGAGAESGLKYGKTTTGRKLRISALPGMKEADRASLMKQVGESLDVLENNIRRSLGYPDINEPISTADAVARIAEVRKTSPRFAGVIETDLHNMVVLSRVQETEDLGHINDLKPGLRNKILGDVWSNYLERTETNVRYNVVPHVGSPGAKQQKATKIMERQPLIVSESLLGPDPSQTGTGPILEPGVGNAPLGIDYEAGSGLYVDTSTGEYIEDYSNLPIEQTAIFEPVPQDETKTYPRVPITPAGVFPSKFATLAPETDPNGPAVKSGDVGVRTFKDAISAFISSRILSNKGKVDPVEAAADRILGRNVEAETLRANILARVDARGFKPTAPNGDPILNVEPTLGQLKFSEIQALANDSINLEPEAPFSDLGLTYSNAKPDTSLGGIEGLGVFRDMFASSFVDGLGIDVRLEPSLFYVPSEIVRGNDINEMLVDINRALQLQNAADLKRAALSANFSDAKAAAVQQLQDEANEAWRDAAKVLAQQYKDASNARNDALAILSDNPKNKTAMSSYLQSGARAEAAKMLLDRHITSNPVALDAITDGKRRELEGMAKARNAKKRMALERIKARANKGIPRNEGAFDNNPELLDPWESATPPLQPRTIDDILAVRAQHRAEGLYDDPTQGVTQLAEEQIDALVAMDELQKKYEAAQRGQGDGSNTSLFTGMPGTPMYGADFNTSQIRDAQVAHFWYYNGSSSLPVLVNQDELGDILTATDSAGNRRAIVITRGVKSPAGSAAQRTEQELEWVNMALRGDRFVPGAGGKAEGHGEYWTVNPSGWSSYHGGYGGTMIAVITDESQIFHKDVFHALFAGGTGELYENMWGIYNAIGAPDSTGVNASHGQKVQSLLPVNSVLPDPTTGQFSPAQIAQLEDVVQKLTSIGPDMTVRKSSRARLKALDISDEWGSFTIEGMYRDSPLGTRPPRGMSQAAWEEMFRDVRLKPDTPENIRIIEETKALRQKVNAWYAQHLSWFVQLAQLRQDESQPGQAGQDAKAYNQRLNSAMRSLLYMGPESRASMVGIDAFIADTGQQVLPSELFRTISALPYGAGDRILMLNRSGMIMLRTGVKHYRDIVPWLSNLQITMPNGGTTQPINPGRWQ